MSDLKLPFSRKMLRTNFAYLALTCVGLSLLLIILSFYAAQRQLRNTVSAQANNLAANIAAGNDATTLQSYIRHSAEAAGASSITLYDDKGAPSVNWSGGDFSEVPASLTTKPLIQTPQNAFHLTQVSAASPILVSGKAIGTVAILCSLSSVYLAVLWQLLVAMLVSAAIAGWLAPIITRRQLAHIETVFDFAEVVEEAISGRDYSLRVSYDIEHELGSLGRNFNQLMMDVEISEATRLEEATQRGEEERRLNILNNHDGLTKLPNRNYFHRLITDCIDTAIGTSKLAALVFLDIDHMRKLNEEFGYDGGDLVIATLTHRLSAVLRSTDTLCRVDGDEFAAILPDVGTPEMAAQLAERLVQAVRFPITLRGKKIVVTSSVGIACCPLHGKELRMFLHYTDLALRSAKSAGGNCFRLFQSSMNVYQFSPAAKTVEG